LSSSGLVALAGTVFGLSFLLVFTEFELASFFRVRHWSVSLFDAQAGGLAFPETWRLTWLPGAIAIAALGTAVGWVLRLGPRPGPPASPQPATRPWVVPLGVVYLLSAAWFSSLFPGWLLLQDAARGGAALAGSFRLQQELLTSVLVAGAASVITFLASGWVHAALRRWTNPAARIGILTLCLPGLLGPLLLSLLMVRVFQIPLLHDFYDSPVPLLLGLCLWLGAPALLCRIVLEARRPGPAHHVAMLSRASPSPTARAWVRTADWRMRRSPWFWLGSLLFVWAYLDLTTAALLAPSGMALVMTRLYNFMHYGQTSMLSAMLTATMLVPAICIGLAYVVGRRGWYGHV
jgi:ABC-type Fe3+ transport system permease subunit